MAEVSGVVFRPLEGGKVSSVAAARAVFSEAVASVDPALSSAIAGEKDWRKGYARFGIPILQAGLQNRAAALSVARAGLAAAHSRVHFETEQGGTPLLELKATEGVFREGVLQGSGERVASLRVPVGKDHLEGAALERELDRWIEQGRAEPGCVEALQALIRNPTPLDLRGKTFVMLGAGAEVGPLRPLLEWGATVIAVDLDRGEVQDRLATVARATAGRLVVPERTGRIPGANLLTDLPGLLGWLQAMPAPAVVGAYAYLDGEKHVRVSLAMDRIVKSLAEASSQTLTAYLMTPTEVFVIPEQTAARAKAAFEAANFMARTLRSLSGGRVFERNLREELELDGRPHGLLDCVETRQGPNYILAKRLQRWRVFDLEDRGHRVSLNVAPMTRTRSVLSNRMYAAGYRGCRPLGIETFDAATTNTVMAALLVHDLQNAARVPQHPEAILRDQAFHGGLWTCPYQLRTIIEAGVAAGLLNLG